MRWVGTFAFWKPWMLLQARSMMDGFKSVGLSHSSSFRLECFWVAQQALMAESVLHSWCSQKAKALLMLVSRLNPRALRKVGTIEIFVSHVVN